jgi:hypothetical protein
LTPRRFDQQASGIGQVNTGQINAQALRVGKLWPSMDTPKRRLFSNLRDPP